VGCRSGHHRLLSILSSQSPFSISLDAPQLCLSQSDSSFFRMSTLSNVQGRAFFSDSPGSFSECFHRASFFVTCLPESFCDRLVASKTEMTAQGDPCRGYMVMALGFFQNFSAPNRPGMRDLKVLPFLSPVPAAAIPSASDHLTAPACL